MKATLKATARGFSRDLQLAFAMGLDLVLRLVLLLEFSRGIKSDTTKDRLSGVLMEKLLVVLKGPMLETQKQRKVVVRISTSRR